MPNVEDHRLPPSGRKRVYELVERVGLNPTEFYWQDEAADEKPHFLLSRVTHKPTGYWFVFHNATTSGWTVLGVKRTPPSADGNTYKIVKTRDEQLEACFRWLNEVRQEYETVDPWAALVDEARLMVGEVAGKHAEERFTAEEREVLRLRLNEIKAYLVERTSPTPEQITQINVTFNYVAEATDRLTKRDWKVAFLGSILPLLLGLAASKDVVHGTIALAAKYILPFLGNLQFPLP